jgi:hypothetical protein
MPGASGSTGAGKEGRLGKRGEVLSYHISVLLDTAVIEEINSETTGYEAKQ